jgi:hypothetical protein
MSEQACPHRLPALHEHQPYPAATDAREAKCGRCRQMLFTGHPTPAPRAASPLLRSHHRRATQERPENRTG